MLSERQTCPLPISLKPLKTLQLLDKLKHCCQNISAISWKSAPHNVPDSSNMQTKNEDVPISLNHNLKLETVGGLSDAASALLGGLRDATGSFDTFTNALCFFYTSPPLKARAFRRNPATRTSVPGRGSQGSLISCETSRSGLTRRELQMNTIWPKARSTKA